MNKKIFLAGLLCLASVASVVGMVGNAHEVYALGDKTWSLVGDKLNSWNVSDKTYTLKWDATDNRYEIVVKLEANSLFKIAKDYNWNVSIGWNAYSTDKGKNDYLSDPKDGNFKVKTTNTYLIYMYDNDNSNYGFWAGDVGIEIYSYGTNEVKPLLTEFYNDGVYTRKTTININKEAVEEDLARKYNDNTNTYESLFHAKAILLERTTYFNEDALWMSNEETNEKGTYSYYGTKYDGNTPVGVTGGRVSLNETTSNVVLSGEGKESMENYYTTMYDIKANEAEWTKTGEVYSTNNPAVIKMFLDFTAPCFLNLNNNEINNYFSLDHVEVEETSNGLELRLVTTGDSGKLTENANNVLSVATITTK